MSKGCPWIGWISGERVVLCGPPTELLNDCGGRREKIGVGGGHFEHRGWTREDDGRTGSWGRRKLEKGDRQVCKLLCESVNT